MEKIAHENRGNYFFFLTFNYCDIFSNQSGNTVAEILDTNIYKSLFYTDLEKKYLKSMDSDLLM